MSVSIMPTRQPARATSTARFAVVLDFPVPPRNECVEIILGTRNRFLSHWSLVLGHWSFAIHWSFVISSWILFIGSRSFAFSQLLHLLLQLQKIIVIRDLCHFVPQ